MADMVTAQELENAKIDARTIGESVNENKIVTPRYGAPFKSMPMIAEEMQSVIGTIIAGGVPASIVADASGLSQQQINNNNESALLLKANQADVDSSLTLKANQADVDSSLTLKADKSDTFTKSEVSSLVSPKADTAYVDAAVGAISTDVSKQYATLALANADIANIALNQNIFVSESANGGYWYKATAGATSLTKSPYDPLTQAKEYTDVQIENIGISSNDDSSIYVAIVDKEGRRTWLEADQTGEPTDYTIEVFKKKLDIVTTVENIACWGDSLTQGASAQTPYPTYLKQLLVNNGYDKNVANFGVGGETSVTIAARQGGNPFIIKIGANTLPADTSPVRVTLLPIGGKTVTPLLQGASSFDGYFNGILCTLKLVQPNGASSSWNAANYYTLQRKTTGTALTIDRPHPFYLEITKPRWGDIHIIWVGQNNLVDGAARHIADAKAMIQKMTAQNKKYIVIPRPFNSVEAYDKAQKDAFDAEFFAAFGRRCVLIRQYLVEYGLADAGLTATSQDLIDIANGTVPEQLRVDVVHWKSAAYQILATQVFNRIKELEYI